MFWTEAAVFTTTEGIDVVAGILLLNDINGYSVEDSKDFIDFIERKEVYWDYIEDDLFKLRECETKVTFYLPDNNQGRERLASIRESLDRLKAEDKDCVFGRLAVDITRIADEDWENNWKQYFKPFTIGQKLAIKPTWEEYDNPENRIVIELDPSSSFGTGSHMTTRLCLEAIEKCVDDKTANLLDMGCGSGILGIGANLINPKLDITAVDIEENSVRIAKENAQLNKLTDDVFHAHCGNVLMDKELYELVCQKKYDVIAANIVSDIIILMAPMFKKVLAKEGTLICSGIITERTDEVESALHKAGFVTKEKNNNDGWAAILLSHPSNEE